MSYASRIRSSAGLLALLAALTLVAAALLTGAPRIANELTDEALRAHIKGLPFQVKDLTYGLSQADLPPGAGIGPQHAAARLEQQRGVLNDDLTSRLSDAWFGVTTPIPSTFGVDHGLPKVPNFGLRAGNGLRESIRIVQGRWPDNSGQLPRVEVVLSELSAKILNQGVGSDFGIVSGPDREPVKVRVVGLFAPLDEKAPIWETEPLAVKAHAPQTDEETWQALYLTDVPGITVANRGGVLVDFEWRYRLSLSGLDMEDIPALLPAILDARRQGISEASATTGLDTALTRFADNARAAQAMFAVVQAGTLATLAGLVLLSARLAATRRRQEFALLRARGAAMRRIATHVLVETALVVPIAALAGWWIGRLAPGRPADTEILLVSFAVIALCALPLIAMFTARNLAEERTDTPKVSLRRRTAEIAVLGIAALGAWLLRRRGLEFDMFLVAVPVLLATAAAIITLRLIPAPLALAGRLAARGRGAIAYLGLTRAGRSTPATVGPIAVLIVAVCTTVFSIGVAGTVQEGRVLAADHDIPADARVRGGMFAVDTRDQLLKVPGVTAVSPLAELPARDIRSADEVGARSLGQTYVLVVDAPTLAEVVARSGRRVSVPGEINATAGAFVPALASPEIAQELSGNGDKGVVDLQGRLYGFEVAAITESFPAIPRTASRFLVLPWQALPIEADKPLIPTGFLVSGTADRAALLKAGDEGQLRWYTRVGEVRLGFEPGTQLETWQERRSRLELSGVNSVLTFSYGVGALGGILLALLAVGFAVLAEARNRGKSLSRLRTMGLALRQGRRLLLYELAPIVTAAVAAGAVVGLFLPLLVGPALNLTTFTDGYDVGLRLDPVVIGGALGLVLTGLGTALLVEAVFNRRTRLGEVLRVGSE